MVRFSLISPVSIYVRFEGASFASSIGCGAIKESTLRENDLGIARCVIDDNAACEDRTGSRERGTAKAVSLIGHGAAVNSCDVPTF